MKSERNKLDKFFEHSESPDRIKKVHSQINLGTSILEISPNWAPLVVDSDLSVGGSISYTDRMPTELLNDREKNNPGRVDFDLKVMNNSFVWTPGEELSKCTSELYDYVISSHVVEHVPDLLGHMIEVQKVLKPDGAYVVVIPNSKGTGEYFRRLSEESDVIEHFFRGGNSTSPGQNWDYLRKIVKFDGNSDISATPFEGFVRHHTDAEAIQDATRCLKEYVDVHCWVFDRKTFLRTISTLNSLNLFPFKVFNFIESEHKTVYGEPLEFIITLKKIPFVIPLEWQKYLKSKKSFTWFNPDETNDISIETKSADTDFIVKKLTTELQTLKIELDEKTLEIITILNSRSWKITAFLRSLRRILRWNIK